MKEDILKNQETPEEKPKKEFAISRPKLISAIVAVAVLLCASVYIGFAGTYDKVYPNTYVNGIDIGGCTYDEVLDIIKKSAKDLDIPEKLTFTVNGKTLTVLSSEVALATDSEKTADAIFKGRAESGFWSNMSGYTGSLFSDTNHTVAVKYNKKKLDKLIGEFVAPYTEKPVDSHYEVNGNTLTIYKGHQGREVDKNALNQGISAYLISPEKPVELSIIEAKAEKFNLDDLYTEITSDATNAYYARSDNGSIVVMPDKPKVKIDKKSLKKALESKDSVVSLNVTSTPAAITKAQLEKALFSGVMGEWTSKFNAGNTSRTANVSISASRINGVVLLPGETFSYDKTVGPRTVENGFKYAGVYINNKVEQGIGGGICQTSSTLYSAGLYANLEIVTRTSHSLPVSYMPPGQDATIAAGAIDFQFKNNTDYPVKIVATINGGSITCQIVGTPVKGQRVVINNTITAVYNPKVEIATDASIPQGYKKTVYGSSGNAVASTRTVYQDGTLVSTEKLTRSVYNATPTTVTVNPADKETDPGSLTEYTGAVTATPPEELEQNPVTPEDETSESDKPSTDEPTKEDTSEENPENNSSPESSSSDEFVEI